VARARNIKPGFFTNDDLASISPLGRILFAGLWTIADREGRLEDKPAKIKACLLPYDRCDVNKLLDLLVGKEFIFRYCADEKNYIQITNWHRHQNPHHMEVPSEIPAPEGEANKYNHAPLTKAQRERIFQRDKRKCVKCGANTNLSIDHIIPVSKGGDSADQNLQTLCQECNHKKGSRLEGLFTSREQVVDNLSTTSSHPTDSLNLIPDSLNLIPLTGFPESEPPATDDREALKMFEKEFARPLTQIEMQSILEMLTTYGLIFLQEATKRAIENGKRNLKYIRAILESWRQANLLTLDDVLSSEQARTRGKPSNVTPHPKPKPTNDKYKDFYQ